MALDHRRILATALGRLRGKLKYRPVVFELLPSAFTLLQLQRVVEALAGVRLHKQNLRRLVETAVQSVRPADGKGAKSVPFCDTTRVGPVSGFREYGIQDEETHFRASLESPGGSMKYRALTVSREYGSGGAEIAEIIAQDLGWKLVDKELILEISRMEQLPASEVAAFDERVDTWLHRLTDAIWSVTADGVSPIVAHDVFNAERRHSYQESH